MYRIIRRNEVEFRTGLSRSSIYSMMAKGHFPNRIRIGLKAVGWRDDEINAWLDCRSNSRGECQQ